MKIQTPYSQCDWSKSANWLKGNLHTHTTQSDGACPPDVVVKDYANRGYGFLAISDHDVYTGPELHAKLPAGKMILVPGNEITANGPHALHIGCTSRIEPHVDRQRMIDDAKSCGFVVMNHPNWQSRFNHCSIDLLDELKDYIGIEIYNGVINRLEGSAYATDKWDMLLSKGRRMWGFANDDSHCDTDVQLGWNIAYVPNRTPAAVVEAMRNGRFYASTGVVINRIDVNGSKIRIETENADRIVASKDLGTRIKTVDANSMELEFPETGATYVRFECWGRGEEFAWTQPFFNER